MIIKNKVSIVTGASSGIGLATAKLLTQKVEVIQSEKPKVFAHAWMKKMKG